MYKSFKVMNLPQFVKFKKVNKKEIAILWKFNLMTSIRLVNTQLNAHLRLKKKMKMVLLSDMILTSFKNRS